MARTGIINLISTATGRSPELIRLESIIRKAGIASLIFVIVTGLLIGGTFFFFTVYQASLLSQKNSLIDSINQSALKEALLVSVQQRVSTVKKATADIKSFTPFYTIISQLTPPQNILTITLDDNNRAVLQTHVGTIDDAVKLTDTLLSVVKDGKASKPQLVGFNIQQDGSFDVTLAFVPKL